jgi:hypothetical protein
MMKESTGKGKPLYLAFHEDGFCAFEQSMERMLHDIVGLKERDKE